MIKSLLISELQEEAHQHTRNYEVVSIRHSNREEHFQKRRKVVFEEGETESVVDDSFSIVINQLLQEKYSPEQMEELLGLIRSQDVLLKHKGVIGVRKIIDQIESQLHNCYACPELKQLSSGETLSLFIGLARLPDYPQLVYEGTLCLANAVSVNSIDLTAIREEGIMEALIELLSGDIHTLAFQNIVLAIGNMTVDNYICRDYFISMGVIEIIIKRISSEEGNINKGLLVNGCWVLTNLCRGQQSPPYDKIERAVLYLACFFQNITDSHVANDCLSVISQQFTRKNNNLDKVIESGAATKIIHCLNEGTFNERGTVLGTRILGNLSAGDSPLPRQIVEEGLVEAIAKCIIYESSAVKRETLWLLSNIVVGNEEITKQVLMHPIIMPQLQQILNSGDILPKKQAFFVAANLTSTFSPKAYMELVVETELLLNLNDLLLHKQWKIICAGLMCLKAILGFFDREGDTWKHAFLRMLETSSGRQILQNLQFHKQREVYSLVSNIIKKYMDVEGEIEIPFSPPSEESQIAK